ncbi:nuclear transport factor 2 family protein [Bosea thiooxidans]|nr:nuclear transport factor 2 family protein [Bosea sp. (in: a-proteobacteria)]
MNIDFEDDRAIRRLISEYCYCLDQHRLKDVGDLFAENGIWAAKYGSATGPAAIQTLLTKLVPVRPARKHFVTNVILDAEPDHVRAVSYYLVVREADAGGPQVSVVGTYFDRLQKIDGSWKFIHRKLQQDIAGDLGLALPTPS